MNNIIHTSIQSQRLGQPQPKRIVLRRIHVIHSTARTMSDSGTKVRIKIYIYLVSGI